jgi:hypothetical protein
MTHTLARPWIRTVALTSVGLATALVLPYVVHLVPIQGGPPLGARLLPIFFASLVLALRGSAWPALAVAVAAPTLNHYVTGMPAGPMWPTLQLELALFTVLVLAALRVAPRVAQLLGPVAYLVAKLVAALVLASNPATLGAMTATVAVSWPGLVLLLVVGVASNAWRTGGRSTAR